MHTKYRAQLLTKLAVLDQNPIPGSAESQTLIVDARRGELESVPAKVSDEESTGILDALSISTAFIRS